MDVAAEGKAIAKVNDLVIFVPYVVPGDVVDLQIKRKKNKYAEAEAVKFHELSPNRAVPFCQHYGVWVPQKQSFTGTNWNLHFPTNVG